jgi:hypothetical protein
MKVQLRWRHVATAGVALLLLCCASSLRDHRRLGRFRLEDLRSELARRANSKSGEKSAEPLGKEAGPRLPALEKLTSRELFEEIQFREKSIYGTDDRHDVFDAPHTIPVRNFRSTAVLLRPNKIERQPDGTWKIRAQSFRDEIGVCANEPFSNQPAAGFCTGFLLGRDRLATAGHCMLSSADLGRTLVVFGFQMRDRTTLEAPIRDGDVYRPVELLGRLQEEKGADWAVVRLDRVVEGREALPLDTGGKIPDSEGIYAIGHPVGLPQKIAGRAVVRNNRPAAFFVANLDTYGGNSGSPVFDAIRNEVVGILVRGEQDFKLVDGCRRSLSCPDTGCRGEDVTRIGQIPADLRTDSSAPKLERLALVSGRRKP